MDPVSLKNKLRKALLQKRLNLSPEEVQKKSESIFRIWQKEFNPGKFRYIHFFLPIAEKNEINTLLIRDEVDRYYPSVKGVVPVTDFENKCLKHVHVSPEITFVKNKFGIPEPLEKGIVIRSTEIDIVLVPLLGFDSNGFRIGYGMGLYDKFLSEVRNNCLKIGLSFSSGFVENGIPIEPHDIKLDGIITENKFLDFRKI